MQTIEEAIQQVLDGYNLTMDERAVADQVITTLSAREYDIADAIVAATRSYSLDVPEEQVRSILTECGLESRPRPHAVLTEQAWTERKDQLNKMIDERVQQWKDELGI